MNSLKLVQIWNLRFFMKTRKNWLLEENDVKTETCLKNCNAGARVNSNDPYCNHLSSKSYTLLNHSI